MTLPYLFVYGTLLRGSGNRFARLLASQARFVSKARMQGRLYDLGRYPGAQPSNVFCDWVRGEIFRLDEPHLTLPELDAYEGPLFARVPQQVYLPSGTQLAWVYVYRGQPPIGRRIASGEWERR